MKMKVFRERSMYGELRTVCRFHAVVNSTVLDYVSEYGGRVSTTE